MITTPFFDPAKSYDQNYQEGPFGAFADGQVFDDPTPATTKFLGQKIKTPLGIPAGPLLNGKYVKAALDKGFDLPVYKTVRSQAYPCHQWPNVLAVHPCPKLDAGDGVTLVADQNYTEPLSITNSFGVPSMAPAIWQADLAEAVAYAKPGQMVIASFQGTKSENGGVEAYVANFAKTAAMVKETGVKAVEVNLSCPNEGTANLLCFDTERVELVVRAIKKELKNVPLILKLAYFADDQRLADLLKRVGGLVQGCAAINTIAATIVNDKGDPALPGEGRLRSGVCGTSIKWAGLEMVEKLVRMRQKMKMEYAVIGVGGVTTPSDYHDYLKQGADAVMSATGAIWNPGLAQEVKSSNPQDS